MTNHFSTSKLGFSFSLSIPPWVLWNFAETLIFRELFITFNFLQQWHAKGELLVHITGLNFEGRKSWLLELEELFGLWKTLNLQLGIYDINNTSPDFYRCSKSVVC